MLCGSVDFSPRRFPEAEANRKTTCAVCGLKSALNNYKTQNHKWEQKEQLNFLSGLLSHMIPSFFQMDSRFITFFVIMASSMAKQATAASRPVFKSVRDGASSSIILFQ